MFANSQPQTDIHVDQANHFHQDTSVYTRSTPREPLPLNSDKSVPGSESAKDGLLHGPVRSESPPPGCPFMARSSAIVVGSCFILMPLPKGHLHSAMHFVSCIQRAFCCEHCAGSCTNFCASAQVTLINFQTLKAAGHLKAASAVVQVHLSSS